MELIFCALLWHSPFGSRLLSKVIFYSFFWAFYLGQRTNSQHSHLFYSSSGSSIWVNDPILKQVMYLSLLWGLLSFSAQSFSVSLLGFLSSSIAVLILSNVTSLLCLHGSYSLFCRCHSGDFLQYERHIMMVPFPFPWLSPSLGTFWGINIRPGLCFPLYMTTRFVSFLYQEKLYSFLAPYGLYFLGDSAFGTISRIPIHSHRLGHRGSSIPLLMRFFRRVFCTCFSFDFDELAPHHGSRQVLVILLALSCFEGKKRSSSILLAIVSEAQHSDLSLSMDKHSSGFSVQCLLDLQNLLLLTSDSSPGLSLCLWRDYSQSIIIPFVTHSEAAGFTFTLSFTLLSSLARISLSSSECPLTHFLGRSASRHLDHLLDFWSFYSSLFLASFLGLGDPALDATFGTYATLAIPSTLYNETYNIVLLHFIFDSLLPS